MNSKRVTDEDIQAQYDRHATIYDRLWRRYTDRTLGAVMNWLSLRGDERVLDVACGTGALIEWLLDRHPSLQVAGVDLSGAMLEVARQKLEDTDASLIQAPADAIPLPAAAFDVVVCANAFHYFVRPEAVLAEVRRVLRPGGRFVLLDWSRDFWICKLYDAVLPHLDPAYQGCYTQAELHGLLEEAGFTLQREGQRRLLALWGFMLCTAVPGA